MIESNVRFEEFGCSLMAETLQKWAARDPQVSAVSVSLLTGSPISRVFRLLAEIEAETCKTAVPAGNGGSRDDVTGWRLPEGGRSEGSARAREIDLLTMDFIVWNPYVWSSDSSGRVHSH